MRKYLILVLGVAASASAGIAVASELTGGDADQQRTQPAGDAKPANDPAIAARTKNPRSNGELGVLVYKNSSGQICSATGEVNGNRVGVHQPDGFEALPLEEGGACGGVPAPITVAVARDPQTDVATVSGRATGAVETIEAESSGRTLSLPLQSQNTFIGTIENFDGGSVTLTVRMRDGEAQTIRTSPFPPEFTEEDFARMRREAAKEQAEHSHSSP